MDKFVTHRGIGIPLQRTDVDTDQVVPSRFLKRVTKTGFEDALFAGWRKDPDFVLNQDIFRGGSVLVAGRDFGIGSSREHAVWALKDYGIKAVISSRFGDIFRGNAGTEGLVAAQVTQDAVDALWGFLDQNPGAEIEVDLEACEIRAGDDVTAFQIDAHTRWRLMNGLDPIDLTLELTDAITEFESQRPAWRALTLPARHDEPAEIRPARSESGVPRAY